MEEKELKLEPKKQAPEKLSYDKLESVANQLSIENNQLKMRLSNIDNIMTRLTVLFKVKEHPEGYSDKFLKDVTAEIEDIVTLPEETEEDESPKKE